MSSPIKRTIKFILITTLTLLFLIFAVVNRETVHLSLFPLPYSAEMPAFLFAILCFALGLIIGWVLVSLKLSKSQRMLKGEHKRVMALQNEISTHHAEKQVSLPSVLPKV